MVETQHYLTDTRRQIDRLRLCCNVARTIAKWNKIRNKIELLLICYDMVLGYDGSPTKGRTAAPHRASDKLRHKTGDQI